MRNLIVLSFSFALLANAHEWDGETYNANSASQQHAAQRLMQKHDFKIDAALLDVGCGDGKITAQLAEKLSGGVLGLDISSSMIAFAQKNFTQKNLAFIQGDAAKIMERTDLENRFDYVTSFNALQWVPNQLSALQGMNRALKSKGSLLITMPRHYPECLSNALLDMTFHPTYNKMFVGFSSGQVFFGAAEYESLLKEAGFTDISVSIVQGHDRFPSLGAFKNFVKQWLPWAQVFREENEKEEFMTRLMERYVAYCPASSDTSVTFFKSQLEAFARKADSKSEL